MQSMQGMQGMQGYAEHAGYARVCKVCKGMQGMQGMQGTQGTQSMQGMQGYAYRCEGREAVAHSPELLHISSRLKSSRTLTIKIIFIFEYKLFFYVHPI